MRTLMLGLALVLIGCNEGDSTSAVQSEQVSLNKVWTASISGHTISWDWTALVEDGSNFSAPYTYDSEACTCTLSALGSGPANNLTVSCTWVASAGADPGCASLDDYVNYELQADGHLTVCPAVGSCAILE